MLIAASQVLVCIFTQMVCTRTHTHTSENTIILKLQMEELLLYLRCPLELRGSRTVVFYVLAPVHASLRLLER